MHITCSTVSTRQGLRVGVGRNPDFQRNGHGVLAKGLLEALFNVEIQTKGFPSY